MFRTLKDDGRLLPGTISRDYDGYTLCHKPAKLTPSEVVDTSSACAASWGRCPTSSATSPR